QPCFLSPERVFTIMNSLINLVHLTNQSWRPHIPWACTDERAQPCSRTKGDAVCRVMTAVTAQSSPSRPARPKGPARLGDPMGASFFRTHTPIVIGLRERTAKTQIFRVQIKVEDREGALESALPAVRCEWAVIIVHWRRMPSGRRRFQARRSHKRAHPSPSQRLRSPGKTSVPPVWA
ncbi:hypothetical protein LY76DRAFT_597618, partial [Colletotrichum caudatum]